MASNTCTPRERMNSFSLLGLLSPTATVNVNPEGNLSEEKAGELRLQLAALDVAAVAAVPVVPAAVARDDMYVCVKQCIVRDSVDASGAKLGFLDVGEVVTVIESRPTEEGVLRVRLAVHMGWTSVESATGVVFLEKADIAQQAEAATIKFDQVFQTSDLNEDGFLCFKEMNVYATCTGGALFEDDFNAMSKALGCKKKKKLLTKEQFVRCYTEFGTGDIHDDHKALYKYQADAADAQKKKAEEDAAAAAAARQGKSKYDQLFDAADTDGDGFLDYKEMCVYAGRTGGTLSMEDFHELTGALGARVENTPWADGMVSREQFKLCYTKYQTGDIDEDHRSFFAAAATALCAVSKFKHMKDYGKADAVPQLSPPPFAMDTRVLE